MLKMEYFYYIIEIHKTGSINRAADKLYLSQPYLSLVLKEMENRLGVRLFHRTNRGVTLTEAGREFLDYALQIVSLTEKAEGLKERYFPSQSQLDIFSMPSFTMMDLFRGYTASHSGTTQICWSEMPNAQVLEEIQQGKCNIGLHYMTSPEYDPVTAILRDKGINFTPLVDEPICAVVNTICPLAHQKSICLKELQELEFLVESIKLPGKKYPVENNPFPDKLIKRHDSPTFNNNRSMLYYLTKSSHSFCVGQKALNLTNPFVQFGALKYIPISDIKTRFITGYLTSDNRDSSSAEEDFINYLESFFKIYNSAGEDKDLVIQRFLP